MSTKCNVIIKANEDYDKSIQLYRHHDGYPKNVIFDLKKALKYAWELPRMETNDFAAAIVRAWKDKNGGNIYIDGEATFNKDGSLNTKTLHGDIAYYYIIKADIQEKNWKIEVYKNERLSWKGHIGEEYNGL